MMRLPAELETELWHDIESIEGERQVKYVTSVERLAITRGVEIGTEKSMEKGREEGRAAGIAARLAHQLNCRFDPLPATISECLASATPEQRKRWAECILDAVSLDAVVAGN